MLQIRFERGLHRDFDDLARHERLSIRLGVAGDDRRILVYQYSSIFSKDTACGERFLTFSTVTMSLPTFLDDTCMN